MSTLHEFKTIETGAKDLVYKEKGSKFIGYAKYVQDSQEALSFFDTLKTQHQNANHCCYAYRLGPEGLETRANDDGEPSHSAGTPILGQIQSFGLTNTALAVVRYFGGTKLGVGGLVKAYKTTAQLTLEASEFKNHLIYKKAELHFDYADIGLAMRWLKQGGFQITQQDIDQICKIQCLVPTSLISSSIEFWKKYRNVNLKLLE